MLVFRTPPYIITQITLQDNQFESRMQKKSDSPRIPLLEKEERISNNEANISPKSTAERKSNRRFSTTSIK